MTDCIFCTVPELLASTLPVYCIGIPVPEKSDYLRYLSINTSPLVSQSDFLEMTIFTPGARLSLTLDDANKLISHRQAWINIMNNEEPYGAIFENPDDVTNTDIRFRLENLKLPKDWDVIEISDTQYVLNKRAAKIFVESTLQYHAPVNPFIESFVILKVFNLEGERKKIHQTV